MVRVEKRITIKAPVTKVFDYMADPMSNLEYMPGMKEVKDIRETKNHIGTRFRWTYKMGGLRFEGETTVLEWIKNERIVTQGKGGINSKWLFDYKRTDEGTALSLIVEYDVPIPVLGKIAEAIVRRQNERDADLALTNVKERMEA